MALNQYDFGRPDMAGRKSYWGYGGGYAMSPGGGGGGYPGLPFWDPMYRENPGMWTILDALTRHDRGIAERAQELRYNDLLKEKFGDDVYGVSFGPELDLRSEKMPYNLSDEELTKLLESVPELANKGTGGIDSIRGVDTPGFWSGVGERFKENLGKALGLTALSGNPLVGFGGAGAGAIVGEGIDWVKNLIGNADWSKLFGEGNEKAAREAFYSSLSESGLGDGVADILSGMYGDRAREPGADEPGVDGSPGVGRGGGNGRPGGFGGSGLPPGGYMGNPNISGMSSYLMEVAGGGPPIPIIQGPQWVGPQWDPEQNMTGYPQFG